MKTKLLLIGATGQAGSRILQEALSRGHAVTAIVRDPAKLEVRPGLTVKKGDVTQESELVSLFAGHDAVISAYHPGRDRADFASATLSGYQSVIHATQKSGVKRLIVVGGAGSLEVAPGVAVVDTPNFPPEYKVEASAFRDILGLLRKETRLDWTYVSPSALFAPGKRTGQYRIGGDQLLIDAAGQSHISMEDFAIALINEVENPQHQQKRFTVGY